MSFLDRFQQMDRKQIEEAVYSTSREDVSRILKKGAVGLEDFPVLVSPAASAFLERMARESRRITRLRFGKVVRLFAPLYLSNECVNACSYCGFNVNHRIERVTLSVDEVCEQAAVLLRHGFRHVLLVSGESPGKISLEYLCKVAEALSREFAAVSIEVYPVETDAYKRLARSGVTGIAVYQETYDPALYRQLHRGPKADFGYRLLTPERAGNAGFRELGIGALLGLGDFRVEMTCVAHHAAYLMRRYWKAQVAVSFPRLRKAEGGFKPPSRVSDRDLAQTVFALRMLFPDLDLVLSTREHAAFRDGMAGIGITRMSAGSRTNPGGYDPKVGSLEQFEVADPRGPSQVAEMLLARGLEPVWKDFDSAFLFDPPGGKPVQCTTQTARSPAS
jgi:2-iminoacetate synthase